MALLEALLEELVPAARVALPFVQSMVEKGLGRDAITAALSEAGISFRRTDMLSLIRGVQGVTASRDYLSSVRNDLLPNPARLPAPIAGTLRSFSLRVSITGRTGVTGELASQSITISSSSNITKAEAISKAVDLFIRAQDQYRPDAEPIEPDTIQAVVDQATFQG